MRQKKIKYVFLGLSILINVFIIFQSCLDGNKSSSWSHFFSNIFERIINSGEGNKVETVLPTSMETSYYDSGFSIYNHTLGYESDEEYIIPLGCTKAFNTILEPENVSDKSVKYFCNDNEILNIVQKGTIGYISGAKVGTTTLYIKSQAKEDLISSIDIKVIDLIAPVDFIVEDIVLTKGLNYLPIDISDDNDLVKDRDYIDNNSMLSRYYDVSKLELIDYNEDILDIVSIGSTKYINALNTGTSSLTVTNGTISKSISVNVIEPTDDEVIFPEEKEYITTPDLMDDYRNDNSIGTPLNGKNVIYSSLNQLLFRVNEKGSLIGYRKYNGIEEGSVRVTNIFDPSDYKDYKVKLVNPTLEDISFTFSSTKMETISQFEFKLEAGNTLTVYINFFPSNAFETLTVTSSDTSKASVSYQGTSFTLVFLHEGDVTITINGTSVHKELIFHVDKIGKINDSNRNEFSSFVRKSLGHFLLFMASSFFTSLFFIYLFKELKPKNDYFFSLPTLGGGIFIASLSEIIQYFVPGRTGSFMDVLVDLLGFIIVIGIFVLSILIRKIIKNRKQRKTISND